MHYRNNISFPAVHYRNRLRQASGLAMLWILFVLTVPAFCDTISWTGSYGNRTDPGSWNSGTVPNSLSTRQQRQNPQPVQTFANKGFLELNGGGTIAAGSIVNTGCLYLNNPGAAGMGNTVTTSGFTSAASSR